MSLHVPPTTGWPDLCALPVVFRVVLLAQIFACVAVLLAEPLPRFWEQWALTAWFVLWLALSGNAWLCGLQRLGWVRSPLGFGLVGYGGVLLLSLLLSVILHHLLAGLGLADRLLPHGVQDAALRSILVTGLVAGVVLHYLYLEQAWRRQVEAEAQARLAALQARIRPHFLFNSLNTIASLLRLAPNQAESVLEDLADLFRAALNEAPTRTLEAEFDLVRRYLAIEQVRLGDRLQVQWALADLPLQAQIPSLSLQPLVENAVYHGIQARPEGGVIQIQGRRLANGRLQVRLQNPLPSRSDPGRTGHGLGLGVTRERWLRYFGAQCRCEARPGVDTFELYLEFPDWRESADAGRTG